MAGLENKMILRGPLKGQTSKRIKLALIKAGKKALKLTVIGAFLGFAGYYAADSSFRGKINKGAKFAGHHAIEVCKYFPDYLKGVENARNDYNKKASRMSGIMVQWRTEFNDQISSYTARISGLEDENKILKDELSKRETNEKIALGKAKDLEQKIIDARKAELAKKGYNDKLQYSCKLNLASCYLFLKAVARKNKVSEEENMQNFEKVYLATQGLDKIFGPDYEKADINALLAGKAENKVENSKFTNTYENKNFDIYSGEKSQVRALITKVGKVK